MGKGLVKAQLLDLARFTHFLHQNEKDYAW